MEHTNDDAALPPGVATAWGVRERTSRGPRRGLNAERIVAAAIEVARRDGLAAVSMSRVAAELDTAPMSLYRHVPSKDDLLALMVDAATGPPPALPDGDWRAGLEQWARAEFAGYLENPWVLEVPITGPPILPNQLAWGDRALRCLAGTGLAEDEKLAVVLLVSAVDRSLATLHVQLTAAMRASGSTTVAPGFGRLLRRVVDARHMPAFREVVDAGVFDEDDEGDVGYEFSLARVLDGVAALIDARGGTATPQ